METTPRQKYLRRWSALKTERSQTLAHWQELSDNIDPWRSQFLLANRNKPRSNAKLFSSVPARAKRTLQNGLMNNASSPSKPWFRLLTANPALAEESETREWLYEAEDRLRVTFSRSNIYQCLQQGYGDLVHFGLTAIHLDEDEDEVLRGYVHPVGTYCVATDARGKVSTVYRELSMTVEQIVEQFGIGAVSPNVKQRYEKGEYDGTVEVLHVVEPNRGRIYGATGPRGMRWKSCWMEITSDDHAGLLRESGYEQMPTLCPRWEVRSGDTYGFGPASLALADIKSLHTAAKRKLQLVGKLSNPALQGPPGLEAVSQVEGSYTSITSSTAGFRVEPLYMPDPRALLEIRQTEAELEQSVNGAFMADLWLMLAEHDGKMTAREVQERAQEKLTQLGPAMERLQDELYDPLIERGLYLLLKSGQMRPPPEALAGQEYKVEYISGVAQAQKITGVAGLERMLAHAIALAPISPEFGEKLNIPEIADKLNDFLGNPPDVVRSDEEMAEIAAQRQQAQQAAAQGQAMVEGAGAIKDLASAQTQDPSALTAIASAFGGTA